MVVIIFVTLISILWAWYASTLHSPLTSKAALLSIVILLILILGLRYYVGIDYGNYEDIYNEINDFTPTIEPLWLFLNDFFRSLGFRSRIFFFITSIIIVLGYYKGIKEMSPNIYLSLFLFIIAGFYLESANIVRQYVAMAILFGYFTCFLNGQYWKYFLCILVASMFHFSALIIAPIIYLSRIKYPVWLLFAILIFTYIYGNSILNMTMQYIMSLLEEFGLYQYEVDDIDSGVNTGLLKLFYHLLVFGILFLYMRFKQSNPSHLYILINMLVIGLAIYNICYIFTPARRLYLYFFTYLIIVCPYCLNWFKKKSQIIITGIVCCVFGLFLLKLYWGEPYNFDIAFF